MGINGFYKVKADKKKIEVEKSSSTTFWRKKQFSNVLGFVPVDLMRFEIKKLVFFEKQRIDEKTILVLLTTTN